MENNDKYYVCFIHVPCVCVLAITCPLVSMLTFVYKLLVTSVKYTFDKPLTSMSA